jgi:hypothetical protein
MYSLPSRASRNVGRHGQHLRSCIVWASLVSFFPGPVRGAFEVDLVLWVAQRAQFPEHGLADIYSTDALVLVRPVLGVLVAEVWLMSESE